ncbi:MAG TPA: PAS domain-containing sensor histidine kinase [Polyangia bacterium]|nr:PAS domain-containing sensor histidine kinase [Polyangia bacterium]
MSGGEEICCVGSLDAGGMAGACGFDVAAMAAAAPDAVVVEDPQGRVVGFNERAERLFGFSKEEAIGRHSTSLLWKEARGRPDESNRQVAFSRKDGSHFVGDVSVGTVETNEGLLVIAAIRDISAQTTLINRLKEENQAQGVSVAFAAHELRTPLNAMVGFAQLLCEGDIEYGTPQYNEALGYVLSSGSHLLGLVNDILDLHRLGTGAIVCRPVVVDDIGQVIGQAVAMLGPVADAKGIDVQVVVDPAANSGVIDPARLKQVVCNYLSNALKFTDRGGRVSIRLRAEGPQFLRLEVEDHGSGIRAQDLGRVFQASPHANVPAGRRRSTGAGLGLILMKQLVEAQGGSVGVHSRPGKGSTFFATFVNHRPLASRSLTSVVDNESAGGHNDVDGAAAW